MRWIFFKSKTPRFPSMNLTLQFKGSTGNNFVQGKTGAEVGRAGKQEQGYILGTDYFYTHACRYAHTNKHTE